jgi:hypothetical protein
MSSPGGLGECVEVEDIPNAKSCAVLPGIEMELVDVQRSNCLRSVAS